MADLGNRCFRSGHDLLLLRGNARLRMNAMKPSVFAALSALAVVNPSPVHALDCRKASLPAEKLICANPELKQADDAMSIAYLKLLRTTANPDFHEALIRSQRRWVEERSHGIDRFGAAAEYDRTDDRKILLDMTRDRLKRLQAAKPIRTMEQQRKLAAQDGGGPFAGYESHCFFEPPPYGSWGYNCLGTAYRQQNDRICSVAKEWANGRFNEYARNRPNRHPPKTGAHGSPRDCPADSPRHRRSPSSNRPLFGRNRPIGITAGNRQIG